MAVWRAGCCGVAVWPHPARALECGAVYIESLMSRVVGWDAVNLPTLSVGQDMDKPEGLGEMEH